MKILHKLRWKLTLSYTLVTVSAFLVVLLILGGILLPKIYLPNNYLNLPDLQANTQKNVITPWRWVLSQTPVDMNLIHTLLERADATITNYDFLQLGSLQFSVRTYSLVRVLILSPDETLLGTANGGTWNEQVGKPFDITQVPGLEAPFKAAMAGETDANRLYTIIKPDEEFLLTFPVFHSPDGDQNQVVGVMVVLLYDLPTRGDVPLQLLRIIGIGLLIFLVGVGIMGAVFGTFFARGLDNRFRYISTTADAWSVGDFSRYIHDTAGDEIAQFAERLDNMAKQLQSLLRRRQDMAISEERNRLARDLHDSAKQQALAASFELGTALTLFDREPDGAKKHLVQADALVDSVRKELTNLVDELRPPSIEGKEFSEILREYALEWSQRSGIELNINIEEGDELSLETKEILFRIEQEALANIARHSSARSTDLSLDYGTNDVSMTIEDNGHGFDTSVSHTGMGLGSMRERAEVIGGNFLIESKLGQGTKIIVTLPKRL